MSDDDNNIFRIVDGSKAADSNPSIPQNQYIIEDINGNEYAAEGFLIFTSHHIAVMRDEGTGAIPVLIMPLTQLKVAEIFEEDEALSLF